MIVADTNVISEVMKPHCAQQVINWFDKQSYGSIFVTSPGLAELYYGIELLPHSKKRDALSESMAISFANHFNQDILGFDELQQEYLDGLQPGGIIVDGLSPLLTQ